MPDGRFYGGIIDVFVLCMNEGIKLENMGEYGCYLLLVVLVDEWELYVNFM